MSFSQSVDEDTLIESTNADGQVDDGGDDEGALQSWKQVVFQRPCEAMIHLELFESGGYEHLLVLNLQQNAIHDLSPLISVAPTLRVLNVSQNAIAQLPHADFWRQFQNLTMCLLEQNRIHRWEDMQGLRACCSALLWLTLDGNPIMSLRNARPFVVNKLPFLKALDAFVVTDQEFMKEPGRPSARFAALSPQMDVSHLRMPLEFADDDAALGYVRDCEGQIKSIHAQNSPSIITQRVVRGFISRHAKFPRLARICELVVTVQKHIRGFLFRQMIKKSLIALVHTHGEQQLLQLSPADSPLFPSEARRGLKKLIVYVQEWKRKFFIKKQAIAIKKIRFWCQMAYQRYTYKSKLLLKQEQEVFIYYTPSFENELLAIAEKAAHRDPFLMAMSAADRERFLKERCTQSGVSVLRIPRQSTCALQVENPNVRSRRNREGLCNNSTKRRGKSEGACFSAIVRVFPSDFSRENHLLIAEKQFIHQDMERIAKLKQDHQLAVNSSSTSDPLHVKQPRAVLVHLTHLYLELEKRLAICNKKILHACIKLQQWKTRPPVRFSLSRVAIRPRGHRPARWESTKIKLLAMQRDARQQQWTNVQYPKMRVLIPWSIDMYLQILSVLDRTLAGSCGPAFALSYEQTRKVNAALSIQSAWRACMRHSKRHGLEVAISRALLCIQRWWRFRVGLRRRLDFLRACLLLGSTINSSTLFMEERVYQSLSDAASWRAVKAAMRPCREHNLHCRMIDGQVEIALTPGQLKLRNASKQGKDSLVHQGSFKAESLSSQRCGAYFPVWLPGAPEHREESMSSRDEDATPLLLVERVQAEPTVLERELTVGLNQRGVEVFPQSNPYRGFRMCQRVVTTSAHVMELSRRLSHHATKAWQLPSTTGFALASTSFVRLTFATVEEARRRALVLLCKTYDPVTGSYARLYSVEALFGAALRHHQWALSQVASSEESQEALKGCEEWLKAEFPSPWWVYAHEKLGSALSIAPTLLVPSRPDSAPQFKRLAPSNGQFTKRTEHPELRASPSPSSTMIPRPPPPAAAATCKPVPLHVIVPGESTPSAVTPHPPPDSSTPSSPLLPSGNSGGTGGGCNRHQLLTDRVGKPKYESVERMRDEQLEEREHRVRDLREERERAMEALIVDRRMLQRESAAEVAGIKLDIDVKLQKLKYEREIDKLHVREMIEREKMTTKRSKLTRHFEKTFVSQSGAMMRLAAREAVTRKQETREGTRKELASAIKTREAEALERRHDAKSYWFVNNQKIKSQMSENHVTGAERAEENAHLRLVRIQTRIKEDKEIKQMLRLM